MSSRQVDRVVNKTRRRRSLRHLRRLMRRGCLLHVDPVSTSICCGFVVQLVPTVVHEI